jgi:hypothetical protein
MEKINQVLPQGIKTMSLVNVAKLNLDEDASTRVAMKISEAVFSEYARIEKPSSLILAGRISDLTHIHKDWVGVVPIDARMKESLSAVLEKALSQHFNA